MKIILKVMALALLTSLLLACHNARHKTIPPGYAGRIMVLSISSDGKYVISTDMSRHAVLWDIPKRSYRILPIYPVNIYSAYFIKNSHYFMLQDDKTNQVIIQNIDGQVVKKFNPGFPTYGEIIDTQLKHYFASTENFTIYHINAGKKSRIFHYYCTPDLPKPLPPQDKISIRGCISFLSSGKLFKLNFTPDEKMVVGSSDGYMPTWHTETGEIAHLISGGGTQTYGTISPAGKYVIAGDPRPDLLKFDLKTGKLLEKLDPLYNPATGQNFNTNYHPYVNPAIGRIVAIKFVDQNHFILICNNPPDGFNYAALFSLTDKKAIKYMPLLVPNKPKQPYPVTTEFDRDQAIDTAPSAHILVMAQAVNNGILVYRYNPKTKTLKQIWAPVIGKP